MKNPIGVQSCKPDRIEIAMMEVAGVADIRHCDFISSLPQHPK